MDEILQGTIAACASFFLITLVCVFIYFIISSRAPKTQPHVTPQSQFSMENPTEAACFDPNLHISMALLKSSCNDFASDLIIGDGSFGLVYKAKFPNGEIVALKKLSVDAFHGLREFAAEMETLAMIHHQNLVRILGYCISGRERILVYEFLEMGSLDQWLHEPTDEKNSSMLSWSARIRIIRGVAEGLAFLHDGCNPCIIHRDIKSSNVLLDNDHGAKIADFGLARTMESSRSHVSTQVAGTMGYMPPEYGNGMMTATVKGDVHSFGMLMLEIATGRRPNLMVKKEGIRAEIRLVDWVKGMLSSGLIVDMLDPGIIENLSENEFLDPIAVETYFKTALQCVEFHPKERPFMRQIVNLL